MAAASDPVVIVSAARTPLGRFMGDLSLFSAHKLGSHVIGAALERAKLSPERVDEVFMGCVLPAGQGQAPARQAALGAKLPDGTVANDDIPLKVEPAKSAGLKPALRANGTITPTASSANADGAAALILTKRSLADRDGLS